jgi:hypothetical protein
MNARNYSLGGSMKDIASCEEIPVHSEAYLNIGARELTTYLENRSSFDHIRLESGYSTINPGRRWTFLMPAIPLRNLISGKRTKRKCGLGQ